MQSAHKLFRSKNSLFVKYFLSFVLVILVPVIIFSSLLYLFVAERMDIEIKSRLESAAETLGGRMDALLKQLEGETTRLSLELDNSDMINGILSVEQRMQRLAELRRRIESTAHTNPSIDTFGIYFGEEKKVMSQKGYYSQGGGLSWEPVNELLLIEQTSGIRQYIRDDGVAEIVISKSIPIHQKKSRNFIYCTVREGVLGDYAPYGWKEASGYIVDLQDRILVSNSTRALSTGEDTGAAQTLRRLEAPYKAVASQVMPWKYVVSIPDHVANADSSKFFLYIAVLVAVLSALGVVFSYVLAHVLYKPIGRLALSARMELTKIKGESVQLPSDELLFINEAVNTITAYSSALEQRVESGRIRVLASIFRHLLEGNAIDLQEVYETLENYMFETEHRRFFLFLAELKPQDMRQKWDGWISRYQFEAMMREALTQEDATEVLAVEMEKYRLCGVISLNEDKDKLSAGFFDKMKDCIADQWLQACLAAGESVGSLEELPGQYLLLDRSVQAAPAREEVAYADLSLPELPEMEAIGVGFSWLEILVNNILIEDGKMVKSLVEEWFEKALTPNGAPLTTFQDAALQITSYLSVVLKYRMPEVTHWPGPLVLRQVLQLTHRRETVLAVIDFCMEAVSAVRNEVHLHGKGKAKSAVDYVEEHYREDISLTQVADLMGMTPQYLSGIFKNQVGMNFTEYINEKRLVQAADLLKEKALAIGDIAQQVGYNSVQYFARKFKDRYGITPTQFRESAVSGS